MEARKVTDPTKKVTDPVLLAELGRRGIDSDYVEFTADYGKRVKGKSNPYAKFYLDLKTGKRFIVISPLPMVDADGEAIEAGWQATGKGFKAKNNLFTAEVAGLEFSIVVRGQQPDVRKAGYEVTCCARLFLGGEELKPVSQNAVLLENDPLNSNYVNNTLEWDYGICKRRLRIIEGGLIGYWYFEKDPETEVRIVYNQSGDFKLKLGKYAVSDDEELITKEQFHQAIYPLIVCDSAAFYPDVYTETSSVDGGVLHYAGGSGAGIAWASLIAGAGTHAIDDNNQSYYGEPIYILGDSISGDHWRQLSRGIFLFDTSALPDGATITAAVFSLYGYAKGDGLNIAPNINVYSSVPASNTALVAGDFDSLGSIALCDNPIAYSGWSTSGYNDFTLNSTGIAAISKTGVTKLGVRNANYDVAASQPPNHSDNVSYIYCYYAEQGTGYKPKLVITYTEGETKTSSDSGSGVDATSLRELNNVETGSGNEQSLAAVLMLSSDGGSGIEIGGLLKSLFSQDAGGGSDSIKVLSSKAGHDLRLQSYQGQVSMPHKEVKL